MQEMTEKKRQNVRLIDVDSALEGQRIDNYLMSTLKGVPKSHIYRLLRTGQVRVNKGRKRPTYRLQSGDIIRIPPVHSKKEGVESMPGERLLNLINNSIIYEDEDLLVINKPSGIAVHGGSGIPHGVIEIIRVMRPELTGLELAHRLDRSTSGCLVLCKNRSSLVGMHELLRDHKVEKKYVALVKGRWYEAERTIDLPLNRNRILDGERTVMVEDDGKEAVSYFTPDDVFNEATLVEVRIKTGRTHQIRVHASHIGRPIAGDDKYGDPIFNQKMREFGLNRLFLHAASIEFNHPRSGERINIHAPLAEDLDVVLVALRDA